MVVVILGVAFSVGLALNRPDLIGLHKDAVSLPSSACIGCHGNKTSGATDPNLGTEEKTFNPNIPSVHARHLDNPLLGLECNTCHKSVDLVEGSAAHLRKQVSVNTCRTCHQKLFAPAPAEAPIVMTLPAGYSEFSIPYGYGNTDAAVVLGIPPESLELATASGAINASDFKHYPEVPADKLFPGVGYQITLDQSLSITLKGDAITRPTTRVLLGKGWNLIGMPYLQPLRWDGIQIMTASAEVLNFNQAERAGLIAKVLWIYDARTNDYQTVDVMEPFKAYWIQAYETVTLIIPRPF